jgi:hypothetical protein
VERLPEYPCALQVAETGLVRQNMFTTEQSEQPIALDRRHDHH